MKSLNFCIESVEAELPAILLDNGEWLFSAQETCVFGELAEKTNASKWVRNNIPPKWIVKLKTSERNGRPGTYLTKPGFYFAICQGKSEKAIAFRDEVFEVLLPKLEASRTNSTPVDVASFVETATAEMSDVETTASQRLNHLLDIERSKVNIN